MAKMNCWNEAKKILIAVSKNQISPETAEAKLYLLALENTEDSFHHSTVRDYFRQSFDDYISDPIKNEYMISLTSSGSMLRWFEVEDED